jgi:arsenite transporter
VKRESIEKYQVVLYLVAIIIGLGFGAFVPESKTALESLLWPVLGILLYTIFTQVKLTNLPSVFTNVRFILSALTGNFVIIPIIVWFLLMLLPDVLAIQVGVAMVLLVPCTDWFITFTHLGKGDTKSAIAFAPLSLLIQMILLPVYLWIFFGDDLVISAARIELLYVFIGIILIPLLAACIAQKYGESNQKRRSAFKVITWFPVPLLAVVILLIAASQVTTVLDAGRFLRQPIVVYIVFLCVTLVLARSLSKAFKLSIKHSRALAFSFSSRNSFVVLPLALALPASFELASILIVFQILVELVGMVVFVWFVPKKLFPRNENNYDRR